MGWILSMIQIKPKTHQVKMLRTESFQILRFRPMRDLATLGLTIAGLVFLLAANLSADVKMPGLFTDNMVLQQGIRVPIWGWADDGEVVTVLFRHEKATATTQHGKWMVRLPAQLAGGPDTLTVTGKNKIELQNVMVGEVWICSGQSNMEWPLNRSFEAQKDIDGANNNMIRLFTVPKLKAKAPVHDVNATWQICSPKTVPNFSAVAFYFGWELQRTHPVAVGLIHTSWGGSPAEVWMSDAVLSANPAYQKDILDAYPAAWHNYQKQLTAFDQEKAELQKQGKTIDKNPPWPIWRPTELYNGMIAPLIPYAIRGAIWYQGESNAGRAHQYRTLFPDMIRNWRNDWGQGDFTFLAVQLAPWDRNLRRSLEQITAAPVESDWAELREAQGIATRVLPKVGQAVITDLGDKDDIHPTRKEPVGRRLALAARQIAYGERIAYSGPIYRSMAVRNQKAILSFSNVGRGLEARDGELKGFAICGSNHHFVWANAVIRGHHVMVSHPDVFHPVAVRYGWADYPVVNLWNKDGLPASPFRTDDFPMLTQPKK
jgi:sialate O-acetylesterase